MLVYVLRSKSGEIKGVFYHYNKAFEFAEQREGQTLTWKHHDSHGTYWDCPEGYTVEEFEVK